MSEFRKYVIASIAVILVSGCGAPPTAPAAPSTLARPADCPPPPPADPATRAGWLGLIAARPDTVGLLVDDGRGTVVAHNADTPMPLASATKVVHLAAYGRAVSEGRIRPDDPVALGDRERWYLPGADANAHPQALDRLGMPRAGDVAADPARTVTVDALVTAMVRESDNAAADWLRDRLGDDALLRAAGDGGWPGYDLPSELGSQILLVTPEAGPPLTTPRAVRGPAEVALARRYAADPAYRADVQRRLVAFVQRDPEGWVVAGRRWAEATAVGSPTQLAAMHRSVATGAFGPGADVARRQLEWRPPSPRYGAVGFKGGSFPGVLTFGMATRRDGVVATAVVLGRGLPPAVAPFVNPQQSLVLGAIADPADLRALACVA